MVQTTLAGWLNMSQPQSEKHNGISQSSAATANEPMKPKASAEKNIMTEKEDYCAKETTTNATGVTYTSLQNRPVDSTIELPPNVDLVRITVDTLPSFRRMTSLLLPVPYPDKFYNDILTDEVASRISMVAIWTDATTQASRVVAGVRCRLISHPAQTDPNPSLYISTLTTLAPFRGMKLARALLRQVTARAIHEYGVGTVTAHVWETNEQARKWYEKVGFKELSYNPEYYRKLKPGGAYLLERKVGPGDLLDLHSVENEA
ncbi:uncharacterized protein PV09_07750 [Verruconis gallopava]|uniref:N-acetyltransferase domain-containing protein n=1 Tax=Verruconis gallopava TaxID=253628 RepID=A0A0D2ANQ5_9PEZI|nr:uncharacterized protein PV09_07750 [Verruconis gallopava]KIW00769.1 hypothetical protein PV09_07750 [Verruconis gallopava]